MYREGTKKGVRSDHVPKLLRILSTLDVAQGPDDLAIPSFRTHRLKGGPAGLYSIWVNGNWRVTFRFVSRVSLSRVLHGHARVSSSLAIRLEEAGVGTARAWLAMQIAHDLATERAAGTPKVRPLDSVA